MPSIRVALLEMTPRLRDIVTDAVSRERDMELVLCANRKDTDLAALRPDALVCAVGDPLDAEFPHRLLRAVPSARVLVIADAGDDAALYELRPTCRVLHHVSLDQVIAAIRVGVDGTA